MDDETVYPVVECPEGPHQALAWVNLALNIVMCTQHSLLLNRDHGVNVEWLNADELRKRGFDIYEQRS